MHTVISYAAREQQLAFVDVCAARRARGVWEAATQQRGICSRALPKQQLGRGLTNAMTNHLALGHSVITLVMSLGRHPLRQLFTKPHHTAVNPQTMLIQNTITCASVDGLQPVLSMGDI